MMDKELIAQGATPEQLAKCALLDLVIEYATTGSARWFWNGKPAPWVISSGDMIIYAADLWGGEHKDHAGGDPHGWHMTFKTLDELINAVIYMRSGKRGTYPLPKEVIENVK